jgi:hypothetical protein
MKASTSIALTTLFIVGVLASIFMLNTAFATKANGQYEGDWVSPSLGANVGTQLPYYQLNMTVANVVKTNCTFAIYNETYPAGVNVTATHWVNLTATGSYCYLNLTTDIISANQTFNTTAWWINETGTNLYNASSNRKMGLDNVLPVITILEAPSEWENRSTFQFRINVTVDPTYTSIADAYVEFSNESAKKNFTLACTNYLPGTGYGINKSYCMAVLNASPTNQTVWWNFTVWVTDLSNNTVNTTIRFFKVDNSTPSIGSGIILQIFGNSSNKIIGDKSPYENNMTVRFNVTSNNTDTQNCYVRAWIQTTTTAGVSDWTLNTSLIKGYYNSIGSVRNCTVQVNGSDIFNVMNSVGTTGTLRLESVAVDNMGHTGYGQNFTMTYNKLKTGWNPLGWIGAVTTLRGVSSYVNYNASYVAVWNNDYQNASWITWQSPINAANSTLVNNGNASGVYVYMDNDWVMLRGPTTRTTADSLWLPVNSMGINQTYTWSVYASTGTGVQMNAAPLCLGTNISFAINTSFTPVPYVNFTSPIVNAYGDANSSWGNPTGALSLRGGANFTFNSTCINITSNSTSFINITNILYQTTPAKTSWHAFSTTLANTTNQTLSQLNATDLAWQNTSDTRCTEGCLVYYSSSMPYINNETVIPAGSFVWVLPDTTAWSRYTYVNVVYNGTAITGVRVKNEHIGTSGDVKTWARPV